MKLFSTIYNSVKTTTGEITSAAADLAKGRRKLDIHLPFSVRELTAEEQDAKIAAELERRAKQAKQTEATVREKRLTEMTDDELKEMQARIHKTLDSRKKAKP